MVDRMVYKSKVVEELDEFYNGGTAEQVGDAHQRALDLLTQQSSLENMVRELDRANLRPDTFKHPVKESPLKGDAFEAVTRAAYIKAIELAQAHDDPVPIDTLWMAGPGRQIEMHVCDGARQVTVLWVLPDQRDWGSKRSQYTSWVVRGDGSLEQTSGYQEDGAKKA
jgi:hypothetical protein